MVEPVLGGELGNDCVTTPDADDSVIEEPVTLTLLQDQIFGACNGCHGGTFQGIVMNLSAGQTYGAIVDVDAQESTGGLKRINSTNTNPNQSYLYKKVSNSVAGSEWSAVQAGQDCTDAMPPSSATGLSTEERADIAEWISDGAPNN